MTTNTYAELKAQADELMRRAEEARRAESAEVVQKIRQQIKDFKIDVAELYPEIRRTAVRTSPSKKEPKYKGPNGQTWTGGSGRKPDWVRQILKDGESIEKYAI